MSIVKMKRLQLLAMQEDREKLLRCLQRHGCVSIEDVHSDGIPELSVPENIQADEMKEQLRTIDQALLILKKYAPVKEGLFRLRPEVSEQSFFDKASYDSTLQEAKCLCDEAQQLSVLHAEKAKLEALTAQLLPWLDTDVPLDIESGNQLVVQFGTLPVSAAVEEIVSAIGPLCELMTVSSDKDLRYAVFFCHASVWSDALEVLRTNGWNRAVFPELSGTAAENHRRLTEQIKEQAGEIETRTAALAQKGDLREPLRRAYDRAVTDVQREEAKLRLRDTRLTFVLNGWVESDEWDSLAKELDGYCCAYEVFDATEEEYPSVPVKLKNNALTRPLNMVTEMYSLPAYGSVDPNPLMAPFFILFYGIMMADMGYGLMMFLAGLIVSKKYRPKGTAGHMFGLLELCGVSTFVFGALTGGFFGDFIPQLLKIIDPASTFALPALFTPLDDTMMILIGAMALGGVQIITGMAISVVGKIRRKEYASAFFEEITWWIVFAGIALMVLKITPLVLYVGIALVLLGPITQNKGMGKLTGIFSSLYNNVTGYFGDILSYSRLMALMLAGSVIAQVFNTLGAIFGNVVMFVIISLLGNTLNFALNLLGCYVHDMRLQCLEYFGKFYSDGGKPFTPLAYQAKYFDIQKT